MPILSDRFATLKGRHIVGLTEANPPHELKINQFELTAKEFKLLYAITDLDEIEKLVASIREKMDVATEEMRHAET